MDIIFQELSRVGATVSPQELAATMLLSIAILALIAGIVRPYFLAVTMLLVLIPEALVARTIRVMIISETMRLVILPLTVIYVAIRMNQSAAAVCLISFPVALVQGPIDPDLNSLSIFPAELVPLSLILGPVVESHERSGHADLAVGRRTRLKLKRFQRVSYLHDQLPRLENLLIRLSVRWHGKSGVLRFESILLFNGSARNDAPKVSLHGQRSILLDVLRIVVGTLASPSLRFLCVQLCIVGFCPTARLTHFSNPFL